MSSSGPDNVREPLHDGAVDWPPKLGWHSRARPIIDATRQFVADNGGLLLVLSSQLFFSIMNVFVKELHDINDPISTFEVSTGEYFDFVLLILILGSFTN
jgi:hypothetical protein